MEWNKICQLEVLRKINLQITIKFLNPRLMKQYKFCLEISLFYFNFGCVRISYVYSSHSQQDTFSTKMTAAYPLWHYYVTSSASTHDLGLIIIFAIQLNVGEPLRFRSSGIRHRALWHVVTKLHREKSS